MSQADLFLSTEAAPGPEDRQVLLDGLNAYNRRHAVEPDSRPVSVFLRDGSGSVRGGLLGSIGWGWLYVELLWVAEDLRALGWGRRLLEAAEAQARLAGCRGAYLNTLGFQAPALYERQGYEVFGVLEDQPPGSRRIWLQKRFG